MTFASRRQSVENIALPRLASARWVISRGMSSASPDAALRSQRSTSSSVSVTTRWS